MQIIFWQWINLLSKSRVAQMQVWWLTTHLVPFPVKASFPGPWAREHTATESYTDHWGQVQCFHNTHLKKKNPHIVNLPFALVRLILNVMDRVEVKSDTFIGINMYKFSFFPIVLTFVTLPRALQSHLKDKAGGKGSSLVNQPTQKSPHRPSTCVWILAGWARFLLKPSVFPPRNLELVLSSQVLKVFLSIKELLSRFNFFS